MSGWGNYTRRQVGWFNPAFVLSFRRSDEVPFRVMKVLFLHSDVSPSDLGSAECATLVKGHKGRLRRIPPYIALICKNCNNCNDF